MPSRRKTDERRRAIRSQGRYRYLSPPHRLLHLPAQTQMHARQAEADQTLEARRRPRQDAGAARSNAPRHGHPPTDRRAPVRNPESVDGEHPLPDENPRKGPNGNEPPRPGLQHQKADPDVRRGAANPRDPNLIAPSNSSGPPQTTHTSKNSIEAANPFLHSLDPDLPLHL